MREYFKLVVSCLPVPDKFNRLLLWKLYVCPYSGLLIPDNFTGFTMETLWMSLPYFTLDLY